MKPQCTTAAECLKELARVMEQFGIANALDAANSDYVKYVIPSQIQSRYWQALPLFVEPENWQFAIAEVEGIPVFIGDELYTATTGKQTVICYNGHTLEFSDNSYEITSKCSWNPPRPKTVMVELTVEDAEFFMSEMEYHGKSINAGFRMHNACRKALEGMK